jgi:glycosyltransferase involved in cell wall biosynthesis
MSKVSICIPNYNYGVYIGDTIQSILNQTYTDFELIVVDDASTDNSMDVITSFHDKRLKVHRNEFNLGITANWNKCLEYATGDYIAIFHSDDVYHREIIGHDVHILSKEEEVHIVGTRAVTGIKNLPTKIKLKYSVYEPLEFMKFLFGANTLVCPSVMMKKEVYDDVGVYRDDLSFCEDQEFYLRAAVKYGFAKIEDFLMVYGHPQQEKTYQSGFKDIVAKYTQWIEEYKILKAKAKTIFDAYPPTIQNEIADYYLYYNAKLYSDCGRRQLLISMPIEASESFASMHRKLSQMKEKIPPIVADII